ncbi:long-chain acyl-CoA synthetase [Micromonospora endolithica]|nr:long-chain acyl-CoA synthetase [Micromonospora endolithica]
MEEALRRVPGVLDAAAVGLPCAGGGEEVVAAVVLHQDCTTDEAGIRTACRTHLTGYKVPRRVVVVTDLPRSQIGKVLPSPAQEPGQVPAELARIVGALDFGPWPDMTWVGTR